MPAPVKPANEEQRVNALRQLHILDTPIEERFDRVTRLACRLFDVPVAAVSLVDSDREWYKSRQGVEACEGGRDASFCGHTILQRDPLIVQDAKADQRFADNPQVAGPSNIRFYAGIPLRSGEFNVGAFCIKDTRCRSLSDDQIKHLKDLASIVEENLNAIELNKALEALKEKEERLSQITENINEIVWVVDKQITKTYYINPTYEKITGHTLEELYRSPRSVFDTFHPDDRKRVVDAVFANAEKDYYALEYRIVRPDGQVRWMHVRIFGVKDASGHIYRNVGVGDDITEKKNLLRQSERLAEIGRLTAGITHEIKNIITVIAGFSKSVLKTLPDGDRLSFPLKTIAREADRCQTLVQDMLAFTRHDKAKMEPFPLNAAIDSILRIVETQAKANGVEVAREFGPEETPVGNKNQIQQVVLNLCNNAVDAMPKGGKIIVRTMAGDHDGKRCAAFEVEDNGPGIPEEIKGKIFDPFFTTKEEGKGTGLGLALVQEIVNLHRGAISMQSEISRGTAFKVLLPLEQA